MKRGGLILEAPKKKDYVHELAFGAAPKELEIAPIGRDISGIPVICQGSENTCVSATLTWIKEWMEEKHPDLSHEWLADISHTGPSGAKPSQVLEPARITGILNQADWDNVELVSFDKKLALASLHKMPSYYHVRDLTKQGIYYALKTSPLAIGVKDFRGVGPHFLAAIDVTEDGEALRCINWWNPTEQDEVIVNFEEVIVCVAFTEDKPPAPEFVRHNIFKALYAKLKFYFPYAI